MRFLILIPARGGSKGVRRKNLRDLNGRPLISHVIEAARSSRLARDVVLSTDDPEIANVARSEGAEVPFIRPAELATDNASTMPVLIHALDSLSKVGREYDAVVSLQPTSPFTSSALIDRACREFSESAADALITLRAIHDHPFWLKAVNDGWASSFINLPGAPTRRQDLPPLYAVCGAIYIGSRGALERRRGLVASYATQLPGERVAALILDGREAFEIDSEYDLSMAQFIIQSVATKHPG